MPLTFHRAIEETRRKMLEQGVSGRQLWPAIGAWPGVHLGERALTGIRSIAPSTPGSSPCGVSLTSAGSRLASADSPRSGTGPCPDVLVSLPSY